MKVDVVSGLRHAKTLGFGSLGVFQLQEIAVLLYRYLVGV